MLFSEKILDFRVKYHLSQKEVGNILGVNQPTISAYEAGKREPNKLNKFFFEKIIEQYERS